MSPSALVLPHVREMISNRRPNVMLPEPNDSELNRWTIGAIAILAYCLANLLHEGLGHGGACLLMGVHAKVLNAIFLEWDSSSVPAFARRIIAAGGGVINLLTGMIALAIVRWARPRADALGYFLWLFATVSLLMAFGYLLFSGVSGIGDWIMVFGGLAPKVVVRSGLTLVGAILYFVVTPRLVVPPFRAFLNGSRAHELQIRRLLRFPYVVGGITFLAAGALNPLGFKLLMISAASAALGGTSFLAWCKIPEHPGSSDQSPETALVLRAQGGWIAAGAVMLVVFIGILGPGIVLQH